MKVPDMPTPPLSEATTPAAPESRGPSGSDDSTASGRAPIEIANEYALVRVREVETGNGRRLEIHAPRLGRTIRLCPLELETLTWQDHDTFSRFLETPFGPED